MMLFFLDCSNKDAQYQQLLAEVAALKKRNKEITTENVSLRKSQAALTGKLKAQRAVATISSETRRGGKLAHALQKYVCVCQNLNDMTLFCPSRCHFASHAREYSKELEIEGVVNRLECFQA